MRILVTGTAGRIGRGIYVRLMLEHGLVGADRVPASTVDRVGDLRDVSFLRSLVEGCDAVVHVAALHAPHVGLAPDSEFEIVNVDVTEALMRAAVEAGAKHFVFTSTTALYGDASKPAGKTAWIDEETPPQPRTIYHRTKIEAERRLEELSLRSGVPVTVLRMSRCFPEPADLMCLYRLNRGVDARDVADAHALALAKRPPGFRRFIISAASPFRKEDRDRLHTDAAALLREHAPQLVAEFERRGWPLPESIDRVYDSTAAQRDLGWIPRHDYKSVLKTLDEGLSEVLPVLRQSPGCDGTP